MPAHSFTVFTIGHPATAGVYLTPKERDYFQLVASYNVLLLEFLGTPLACGESPITTPGAAANTQERAWAQALPLSRISQGAEPYWVGTRKMLHPHTACAPEGPEDPGCAAEGHAHAALCLGPFPNPLWLPWSSPCPITLARWHLQGGLPAVLCVCASAAWVSLPPLPGSFEAVSEHEAGSSRCAAVYLHFAQQIFSCGW